MICSDCDGTGRVSDTSASLLWGAATGAGWWPMDKDCETCDGTGEIDAQSPDA